jgi:hypothetical protein
VKGFSREGNRRQGADDEEQRGEEIPACTPPQALAGVSLRSHAASVWESEKARNIKKLRELPKVGSRTLIDP